MTAYITGIARDGRTFRVLLRMRVRLGESRPGARADFERAVADMIRRAVRRGCVSVKRHRGWCAHRKGL